MGNVLDHTKLNGRATARRGRGSHSRPLPLGNSPKHVHGTHCLATIHRGPTSVAPRTCRATACRGRQPHGRPPLSRTAHVGPTARRGLTYQPGGMVKRQLGRVSHLLA